MNVVVLGASDNPDRYSYRAVQSLLNNGHSVFPVGIKKSTVLGIQIINSKDPLSGIHTITLYLGPYNQKDWFDFILKTAPQRLIFNPGTENFELIELAKQNGIEVEEACTLVMLATNQFE
ncbi:CoA-binding protein [Bacteroidota bacterium]